MKVFSEGANRGPVPTDDKTGNSRAPAGHARALPTLDALFEPRSVAIIGASADPTRVSGRPVQMLKDAGYAGQIYPVNASRDVVQGLKAYRSLGDINAPIDLALISVPAAAVEQSLHECCRAGVGAAIIFGSGFAEVSEAGRSAQEHLARIARAGGVRLLGPNCMGMFNVASRAYVTFSTVFASNWPEPGNVGLVSQSGAFAAFCFARARLEGLRLSYGVSTGNEADIDFADCLEWLARNERTRVIIGFMEGFRDGAKLCRAFEVARAHGKPVVILKVGRSPLGIETAKSHTAQLSGEDQVYDAVFARYGVHRAQTLDELFDVARLAASGAMPAGKRLGIVTVSGGAGVLMSDSCWRHDVDVPSLPDTAIARLRTRIPFATVHNPIDTTGIVLDDRTLLPDLLATLSGEGGVDAVAGFYAGMGVSDAAPLMVSSLTAAAAAYPKVRQIACTLATPEVRETLWAAGIPVFDDPERAVSAFAALARIGRHHAQQSSEARPAPVPLALPVGTNNEYTAKALLRELGIHTPQEQVAQTPQEAARAAEVIGYPVVVKVLSHALPHKTEAGAVALPLHTSAEVIAACERMLPPNNPALAGVPVEGLLVARLVRGTELIVGLHRDPVFGAIIMVGLGGIHAELLQDRALALAPVGPQEALAMIKTLKAYAVLAGARGQVHADLKAAADVVSRLSAALLPDGLSGIEINPLMVGAAGDGACAVDALVR